MARLLPPEGAGGAGDPRQSGAHRGDDRMKTGNLKIRAIDNSLLAEELEKALRAKRGVRAATVRPGSPGGAEVEYDEAHTTLEQLVAHLQTLGYDVEIGGYSAGGAP
jgi:ClpP class serine protease